MKFEDFKKLSLALRDKPFRHHNHKKPVTRRELLGQGFITWGAAAAMPGILCVAEQKAFGLECVAGDAEAGFIPYLHFELNGGASIAHNFMFGKQQNGAAFEALAPGSYASLGLGPNIEPSNPANINMDFGSPMHTLSNFLAGMQDIMSAEAIAKTTIIGGAGESNDDSANNPLNGAQLAVAVAEAQGKLVQLAGTRATASGARTRALNIGEDPSLSRATINQASDVLGLIDPGLLNADDALKIAKAAQMMSDRKLAEFQAKDLPTQVRELVQCGYIGANDLLTEFTPDSVDPLQDAQIQAMNADIAGFNINDGDNQRVATMTKLLLDGNAAAASLDNGGYDYHGQGRATQDTRDREAGNRFGIALELAHRKGQPLFVAVTSDGSVAAGNNFGGDGRSAFRADSGSRGAYLIMAIGREARPDTNFTQIGSFSDAGAVDTSYLVTSNNPNLQALNIVQNYASFNDKLGNFDTVLQRLNVENPFAGNDNQYLALMPHK